MEVPMPEFDAIPIDRAVYYDSYSNVPFHIHINEFDDVDGEAGRIWAVDVRPQAQDDNRKYFVVSSVYITHVALTTVGPFKEQPRAYLKGIGRIVKSKDSIMIYND